MCRERAVGDRRKRREKGEKRRERQKGGRQASNVWLYVLLLTGLSSVAVAAMFGVCVVLDMCDFHLICAISQEKERRGRKSTHLPVPLL